MAHRADIRNRHFVVAFLLTACLFAAPPACSANSDDDEDAPSELCALATPLGVIQPRAYDDADANAPAFSPLSLNERAPFPARHPHRPGRAPLALHCRSNR